jgi:NAD(P)-dependent dehydrogenase (short-subunit alcohol dehydrogenase family)
MIPQNSGKIINICSLFSYLGGQWSPAYSATKHALAGFTKAYCDELGQYNIQVNGIAPGYYTTILRWLPAAIPKPISACWTIFRQTAGVILRT